jgi:hypothetical protein
MKFPKLRLKQPSRAMKLDAAEAVGVWAVLYGIATWSLGAAFIIGGLALIFAIERR